MTATENLLIVGSLATAALAFVFFVIFLGVFLHKVRKTFAKLDEAIQQTNELSCDIRTKLICLQPFFRVIAHVGEKLECSPSLHEKEALIQSLQEEVQEKERNVVFDILECLFLSVRIWKKIHVKKET
jgi:uncharacterized protein YoxC